MVNRYVAHIPITEFDPPECGIVFSLSIYIETTFVALTVKQVYDVVFGLHKKCAKIEGYSGDYKRALTTLSQIMIEDPEFRIPPNLPDVRKFITLKLPKEEVHSELQLKRVFFERIEP